MSTDQAEPTPVKEVGQLTHLAPFAMTSADSRSVRAIRERTVLSDVVLIVTCRRMAALVALDSRERVP